MAQASATLKDEFENTTKGHVGVITLDPTGKERGIAVRPGATVWLTESEQILTANAPRRDEDNPFTNGQLALKTEAGDIKNRRPIGNQQAVRPEPEAEPPAEEPPAEEAPRTEPKPKPATARQREDRERAKKEAKRKADAEAQAETGVIPGQETGSKIDTSGTPKVEGKSAPNEEVGDPAATAAGAAE